MFLLNNKNKTMYLKEKRINLKMHIFTAGSAHAVWKNTWAP